MSSKQKHAAVFRIVASHLVGVRLTQLTMHTKSQHAHMLDEFLADVTNDVCERFNLDADKHYLPLMQCIDHNVLDATVIAGDVMKYVTQHVA